MFTIPKSAIKIAIASRAVTNASSWLTKPSWVFRKAA